MTTTLVTGDGDLRRLVTARQVMGTFASVHVLVRGDADPRQVRRGVEGCLASLQEADRVFSPFREDSQIRRIARGELARSEADPAVVEVEAACRAASVASGGRFSAWWRGWFDPTGYVKGWAVDRAFAEHLRPLLDVPDVAAVGVNVGGDLRLQTAAGADWTWRVGIVDPVDRSRVLAWLPIVDGAVATSGTAERGAHIVDPRTGRPCRTVASATVVADRLTGADLWATTAVVAGFADLSWIATADTRTGLLVAPDGRTRRWAGVAELSFTDADRSATAVG